MDALRSFDQSSKYSISMEIHPRMAWIYWPPGNCRRRGGVGVQDRWRHGWRHRAPMDGFTACPAHPHRPAIPGSRCCSCFGRCLCGCRAPPGRSPLNPPEGSTP
ncbi:hypothetical protein FJP65_14200 [Stenotrophomonas maltophilia]|nr:hypothetical protein FJP65_14200 [Stenotrophomonas maltophilia]